MYDYEGNVKYLSRFVNARGWTNYASLKNHQIRDIIKGNVLVN